MIELYKTLYYSEIENKDILLDYINMIQRMKKFLEYRCDNNLEAHPDEKVWEDIIKIQKEMLYIAFESKEDFKGIYELYQKFENDDPLKRNLENINWFQTMPFNVIVEKSLKDFKYDGILV